MRMTEESGIGKKLHNGRWRMRIGVRVVIVLYRQADHGLFLALAAFSAPESVAICCDDFHRFMLRRLVKQGLAMLITIRYTLK